MNAQLVRSHIEQADRPRGGKPRLLSPHEASTYTGLSYWSMRDLVMAGHLPSVRLPAPRARDGRNMRQILIDKEDLDALIERWKECDPV